MRLVQAFTRSRVEIQPWQKIPERMAALGLTVDDVLTQVWHVSADSSKLTGGAEAVNNTIQHVWYLRPISWLYYVPGIRQLQDRLYKWIAVNRYKMPGSTAACAIDLPKNKLDK